MRVLFITWDGNKSNFLESLFLPIFKGLKSYGINVSVYQMCYSKSIISKNKRLCQKEGIDYHYKYVNTKRFILVNKVLSVLVSLYQVNKLVSINKYDSVLARSTIPAFIALILKHFRKFNFIFDADGLPVDERIDYGGVDPLSLQSRISRDLEYRAIIASDHIVTRTQKAIEILGNRAGGSVNADKFSVVTNGISHSIFHVNAEARRSFRKKMSVKDNVPVVLFCGTIRNEANLRWAIKIWRGIRENIKEAKLLILTSQTEFAKSITNIEDDAVDIIVKQVPYDEVVSYMNASDLGLCLLDGYFSSQAISPIKYGEYLLSGLPVIGTKNVGDTSLIPSDVGFFIDVNNDGQFKQASTWFSNNYCSNNFNRYNIYEVGYEFFSTERSVKQYSRALGKNYV